MRIQSLYVWMRRVAGVSLLAVLPMAPAHAGVCLDDALTGAGNTCTFNFSNTNVSGVVINIEVIVNNVTDPLHSIITVNYLSSNISNTPLGIDEFAYNSTILPSVSSLPGSFGIENCSTNPAPCTMDGFGDFDTAIKDPGGGLLNFTFMLAGHETIFADNSHGGEFALHIRFDNNCSGFVSDGTAAQNPDAGCQIVQQTPEPGTLVLFGIAVAGLGYARSRLQRR
jgi:hypothetical protein